MWLEWITWEPVNFANTGQWPWNVRPGRETASPLGTVGFPVLTGRDGQSSGHYESPCSHGERKLPQWLR